MKTKYEDYGNLTTLVLSPRAAFLLGSSPEKP